MTRLWLDTEFNEFGGDLISMALVADDGREWYEVLPCINPKPWVKEHVLPFLKKKALPNVEEMTESLRKFLAQFQNVHIVADWPEDISHFCKTLIVGPGLQINTPSLSFEIRRDLPDTEEISAIPHNALEDARALRRFGKDL